MDKKLIDTNILCASILQPGKLCYKLLQMSLYNIYEPIFTEAVVAEFINKCRTGLTKKNIRFTDMQIDTYLDSFYPVLSVQSIRRVSIGRNYMLHPKSYKKSLEEILYELTGHQRQDLLQSLHSASVTLPAQMDLNDLHVMVGALEHNCDSIVTRNLSDFPPQLGTIKIETPEQAYAQFTRSPLSIPNKN